MTAITTSDFNMAGLRTQLVVVNAATGDSVWTEFRTYSILWAGIMAEGSSAGAAYKLPHPDDLAKSLKAADVGGAPSGDRRRFGKIGLTHRG